MHRALTEIAHRPWPIPPGPWIMAQSWHNLLFAHWPIDAARLRTLRPLIPAALEIDTFDGEAWIGVVPFRMSGVRLRGTPALPTLSAFPELNVRTYVKRDGKPGVWFFSLDAGFALENEGDAQHVLEKRPVFTAVKMRWPCDSCLGSPTRQSTAGHW